MSKHPKRWNALGQTGVALGQFGATLLLARSVSPEDFGLLAAVYLVSGLVVVFDEGSFTTLTFNTQEYNPRKLTQLFYKELWFGVVLAVLVVASIPVLTVLFGLAGLVTHLLWLVPVFLLSGPRRFYYVWLCRHLAMKHVAWVRLSATVLFLVVLWGSLFWGTGTLSLAYALFARMSAETLGYVLIGIREVVPGAFRQGIRFGSGYGRLGFEKVGERLLNYTLDRIDVLLVGGLLGAPALGVYDAFKRLSLGFYQQVIPMISRLALPVFAEARGQPQSLASAYLQQVRYASLLLFPAYLFQAVFAEAVVGLLFGASWVIYAGVFRWLSLLLLVRSVSAPLDALLVARGLIRRELLYTISLVALMLATLTYFASGGLEAAVTAIVWLHVALLLPVYWWVIRPAGAVGLRSYLRAFVPPVVLALASCAVTWMVLLLLGPSWGSGAFVGAFGSFLITWLLGWGILRRHNRRRSVEKEFERP